MTVHIDLSVKNEWVKNNFNFEYDCFLSENVDQSNCNFDFEDNIQPNIEIFKV